MTIIGSRIEGDKPSLDDYPAWLERTHKIDGRSLTENYYDMVTSKVQT